jgi:hypothetical protein
VCKLFHTHTHTLKPPPRPVSQLCECEEYKAPYCCTEFTWRCSFVCSHDHHIIGRKVYKVTLFTSWRHIREVEVWANAFFGLAVEGWVVSFVPWPVYPKGKKPGAHWLGGWVGPIASLNILEVREILASAEILTLDYPACSLVSILTTLSKLLPCHWEVTESNQSLSFALFLLSRSTLLKFLHSLSNHHPNYCNPEDGGSMFLQNIGMHIKDCVAMQSKSHNLNCNCPYYPKITNWIVTVFATQKSQSQLPLQPKNHKLNSICPCNKKIKNCNCLCNPKIIIWIVTVFATQKSQPQLPLQPKNHKLNCICPCNQKITSCNCPCNPKIVIFIVTLLATQKSQSEL